MGGTDWRKWDAHADVSNRAYICQWCGQTFVVPSMTQHHLATNACGKVPAND